MVCHNCRTECARHGRDRYGHQRYQCRQCFKTFLEPREKPLEGMYLPLEKAEMALKLLLEGSSVSSVERLTEVHHTTILKLLVLAGQKCERIMADKVRNVKVRDVQLDEAWCFVQKKQKRVRPGDDPSYGDNFIFVALEANSKLVLNFALGKRDQATTDIFIEGLRQAVAPGQFQVTSDGFGCYPSAISNTLDDCASYAQQIKIYRAAPEGERRYSPPEVAAVEVVPVIGRPDPMRISTSFIERHNLTLRMQIRRLTRLTNGFSKRFSNLWAALCLFFAWYNFCRIHRTLRVTPAMEAGITDHVWEVGELLTA